MRNDNNAKYINADGTAFNDNNTAVVVGPLLFVIGFFLVMVI